MMLSAGLSSNRRRVRRSRRSTAANMRARSGSRIVSSNTSASQAA
jgi:hypothetical protein